MDFSEGDHVHISPHQCGQILFIKTGHWGGPVARVKVHDTTLREMDVDLGLLEKFGVRNAVTTSVV